MSQLVHHNKPEIILQLEERYRVSIIPLGDDEYNDVWRVEDDGKPVMFLSNGILYHWVATYFLPVYLEIHWRKKVSQWN